MFQEYADLGDLKEYIKKKGSITQDEFLNIMTQSLSGYNFISIFN